MANLKVKLMVGDMIKGTFNNIINLTPKRMETKREEPMIKSRVTRVSIGDDTRSDKPVIAETETPIIKSKLSRGDECCVRAHASRTDIAACILGGASCAKIETPKIERASTEEELDVFDSIENKNKDEWTESEKAFMLLYSEGLPSLLELEFALIPIRKERGIDPVYPEMSESLTFESNIFESIQIKDESDWSPSERDFMILKSSHVPVSQVRAMRNIIDKILEEREISLSKPIPVFDTEEIAEVEDGQEEGEEEDEEVSDLVGQKFQNLLDLDGGFEKLPKKTVYAEY